MRYEIIIPRLGWSMEEGVFVRWLKRDGDSVRRGEALFELEGEKAVQEIEAVDDGVFQIPPDGPRDGDVVAVGKVVGHLVADGEVVADANPPIIQSAPRADVMPNRAPVAAESEAPSPTH